MVYEVIWSPKAISSFIEIQTYTAEQWTDKEVENFAARVEDKLETLKMQPRIGRPSKNKHLTFRTLIHRKISLVYKIRPAKKEIELITFWNNLRDPNKFKY